MRLFIGVIIGLVVGIGATLLGVEEFFMRGGKVIVLGTLIQAELPGEPRPPSGIGVPIPAPVDSFGSPNGTSGLPPSQGGGAPTSWGGNSPPTSWGGNSTTMFSSNNSWVAIIWPK